MHAEPVHLPTVPRWRTDFGRAIAGGIGIVCALAIAGWPSDAASVAMLGVVGTAVGLLVSFGIEKVVYLRAEVVRLQSIERRSEAEHDNYEARLHQADYQVKLATRTAAVSDVHMKVWSDAFVEIGGSQRLPLSAILARIDVTMKARGLDVPLPPYEYKAPSGKPS